MDPLQPNDNEIFKYLQNHADPLTNVVILPYEPWWDRLAGYFDNFEDWDYWDDEGSLGPSCYLCNEVAFSPTQIVTVNGIVFKCAFTNEPIPESMTVEISNCVGFLQCVFCFNIFHRHRCSVSMSDESYLNCLKSGTWSCPNCVPEFVPFKVNYGLVINDTINYSKLLFRLAKLLNPILSQLIDIISKLNESELMSFVMICVRFFPGLDIR